MTSPLHVAGTLTAADVPARTVAGVLLPYGTPGRTSAGRVTASTGTLTLPADPRDVSLNIEHDYTRPVGRASGLTDTDDGLQATFLVANTRAGDDLLEEVREGLRTHLSVEVDDPIIRGGRLVGGRLTAAAAVVRPAFDGADLTMTAADTPDAPDVTTDTDPSPDVTPSPPGDGPVPHDVTIDGVAYVPDTDTAPPDTDTTTGEDPTVTDTLTAAVPRGLPAPRKTSTDEPTYRDVVRLYAAAHSNPALTAALVDIPYSGAGSVSADTTPPAWIGELWAGRQYTRKYVPLVSSDTLTGMTANGWRWVTPPEVDDYAGNKTPVPSNAVDTEPVSVTAKRLAGAHDIDRAYRDFQNDGFWNAYFRAMTESYARKSDAALLADLIAGATPVTGGGTVSTTSLWSLIIDGAIAVAEVAAPTFAVVGTDIWRSGLLTPSNDSLAMLTAALSLEEGSLAGFRIIPSSDPALAGKALVGAREAATFFELPGSPLRIEGLDIARAGVDPLVLGYYATVVNDAQALALVTGSAVPLADEGASTTRRKG